MADPREIVNVKPEYYVGHTGLLNVGGPGNLKRPFLIVGAEIQGGDLLLSGILSLDPKDETGWLVDRGLRPSLHYFSFYVRAVRIGTAPGQFSHL